MAFDNPLGYILSISMCMRNFITIFHPVQEIGPFSHFYRIWNSAKPRPTINVILKSFGLDLVSINVSAKYYQNIPNGLRIMCIFQKLSGVKIHANCPVTDTQNLELGKASTNDKWYLAIPLARSCQYQCVCKISSQYSTQFKR